MSPGTGATCGYETPCRSWEPDPGPLQERQVLLPLNLTFLALLTAGKPVLPVAAIQLLMEQ